MASRDEFPMTPDDLAELQETYDQILSAQMLNDLEEQVASRDYVMVLPLDGVDVVNMFRALHHAEETDCDKCSDYLGALIEALVWHAWTNALEINSFMDEDPE